MHFLPLQIAQDLGSHYPKHKGVQRREHCFARGQLPDLPWHKAVAPLPAGQQELRASSPLRQSTTGQVLRARWLRKVLLKIVLYEVKCGSLHLSLKIYVEKKKDSNEREVSKERNLCLATVERQLMANLNT